MNRYIKKILMIICSIVLFGTLFMFDSSQVFAKNAVFQMYSNANTVYYGNKFNVTLSISDGAGYVNISCKNGYVSNSYIWLDNQSTTITVTPAGTGKVTVTGEAVVSAYDQENYSGDQRMTRSVDVSVINKPSGGSSGNNSSGGGSTSKPSGGNTSTNVPEEEEVDVTLKSLSVSEGSLTPEFSANTHNYEVVVGNKVEKLEVKAEANDENAKVEGTGEITLKEVETKVEVKVINEDESNTYTIEIIKETPVVYVGDYGILNEFRNADILEGFEDYKIQIDGVEVIAKKNPASNIVVVYALNEEGDKAYYIYNEKKNKITSIYKPIALLGNQYVMVSVPEKYKNMEGFKFGTVKIGEQEFEGWTFNNKEFKGYSLVYLMDKYGKEHLYQYEESEQVLQIYNGSAPVTQKAYDALHEEMKMYQLCTYILAPTAGVIGISAIALAFMLKKKKEEIDLTMF